MQVKSDPDSIQSYLTDASNLSGGFADRLFLPETLDDLRQAVASTGFATGPVTIAGARTGTVGGAVPFGSDIISLEKFNKIISIDRSNLSAVVEPGVILGDFQKTVEAAGLFYPPDPTEWSSQLGGTAATNASGARSFRYGATRDYVKALKVVLADGDLLDLKRGTSIADADGILRVKTVAGRVIEAKVPTYRRPSVRKNVSGYYNDAPLDAVDLFIGSEGTLGIIAELTLKLIKKPENFFSAIVFFADERDLLNFVSDARRLSRAVGDSPIDATLLEYFDARSLKLIAEQFSETPVDAAGAVFFEQQISAADEDEVISGWNDLLEKNNADIDRSWFATSEQDRGKMRAFRHALPVAVNERIVRSRQKKVGTDMSVPEARFESFLQFYREKLDASGLEYVIFGHIGDCHLHANILPCSDGEARLARHLYGRFIAQAIMLGGAVSAEHGIGKLKSKYLHAMMGERYLNEMADVKRAFDPLLRLGRGNMIAERFLSV